MRILTLVALSLFSISCTISPIRVSPISTYTLAVNTDKIVHTKHAQKVLLVTAPTAAPGYQSANMIYTTRAFELNSFAQNRWTAPPAAMLAPLLAQKLQASGCLHAVVSPPFAGAGVDLILDTQLLTLQQEFIGNTNQVRLAMQLTLVDNLTRQILVSKTVATIVPADANTPYGGVIAANKATEVVLNKIKQIICQLK